MLLEGAGYKDLLNQPRTYMAKREIEKVTGIKNLNMDDVLSFINYQKAFMITPNDSFKRKDCAYEEAEMRACYRAYENYKQNTGTYDFDDWIINTINDYASGKITKTWKYVLVDEMQDTNLPQYQLIKLWCPSGNVFVVGDISQSIYEWRGASPVLFANFHKEFSNTKIINMNTNYRSSTNIVERANKFIKPYSEKYGNYKDSVANNQGDGHIETHIFDDNHIEADAVVGKIKELIEAGADLNEITVLYRNNAHADIVESLLKREDIEYTLMSSQSFFDKKEIRGIAALLRLIAHSNDDEAFEICMNEFRCYPLTYFKKELMEELLMEAGKRDCSLFEAFMDHRFELDWQIRNRNYFIDAINRLKLQNERRLPVDKLIDNINRVFKVPNMIYENYESNLWDDKLDSINNLREIAKGQMLESFLEFVVNGKPRKNKKTKGVVLRTVHSMKGLQSKYVFLISLQSDKFPSSRSSIDEESHIFYVGVTRATEWQWVSSIGQSKFFEEYSELC
jgi:DNA helicase-2/ATP-dependent DNA helicase PcrA